MNTQHVKQVEAVMHDELILVVKRDLLFKGQAAWHGLKTSDIEETILCIDQHKEFLPRSLMEVDTSYKQIIPYLVFMHENKYFLMQRQSKTTEQRLKNKYSMGIGGHINQEDMTSNSIIDWAKREFHEEISYKGDYAVEVLGMLNDDSNPVGEVHLGLVLLLHGDSADIAVKSELKSGLLVSLEEAEFYYPNMESWTQIVYHALQSK